MIETALQSQLSATTAVTALTSTRIYHARLPQNAQVPAVVYRRISRVGFPDYRGVNTLVNSRIQVDCYAQSGQVSAELAEAVRISLNGLDTTIASVRIYRSFMLDDVTELREVDTELYRRRQDYQISHDETTT